MQYMLLIYQSEAEFGKLTEAQKGALHQEYGPFTESVNKSGHFRAGNGLQPTATATTVRMRSGKRLVTDGPFAETKEQLAGYYLIEAKDLDDALAVASRIPSAKLGAVEIRPVMGE
jgi:hypothetical protein